LNILALDTTTRGGSAAVARDGSLLAAHTGDPDLTHGQRLPGDLMRTLDRAGVRVEDLGLLAVASGPGSFTGLRVGIAAIQGLAIAKQLPVVPVPTLDALAASAFLTSGVTTEGGASPLVWRGERFVAAWMDAQRGEVYAALYRVVDPHAANNAHEQVHVPIAAAPAAVLESWGLTSSGTVLFIGDGAVRYGDLVAARHGSHARVVQAPPLAPAVARIAFEYPQRAVNPHALEPVYIRRPDAELARDRREGRG
jgi:tRNA threonylcarbamoyladenosine biosynthesis protein TsaB